ncbi:DUF5131 family protein [Bradyrhizobium sp. F1.13.3]|uniref:DUF5131 family protein n=1 Tax=Bradyrhizobium sp. F1.13.3 TaxID=3156351 RepID=UPI003393908C
MAQSSAIEWTDATVNFWWGCTKVGPGCDHCYAETWSKRTGGSHWGHGVPRRKIASAAKLIHRLDNDYAEWAADRECGLCGPHAAISRRVFIQSMSDLFDLEVPVEWFAEAWGLIKVCDRIEIQIVTKRISAVEKRLAAIGEDLRRWPQASRDTGHVPPHPDWLCLARAGRDGEDGLSIEIEGTFDPARNDYRRLSVVSLNGGSFIARRDNPGPCPGEGWKLMASQGKTGKPGERGGQGLRGPAGPGVASLDVNDQGLLTLANGDGSTVEFDLYPLLSKLQG